jgi:hypothetical protein
MKQFRVSLCIQTNVCPLCGNEIIPEKLQNILIALKNVMEVAKDEYMDEVKDWLASNYSLGAANKNNIEGVGGNSGQGNDKLSGPALYSKFAARAGVPGASQGKPQPSLSSVVAEIKGRSEPMDMSAADEVDEMSSQMPQEDLGDGDHNAIVEAFSQGNVGVGNTAAATTFNSERMRKLKAQSAVNGDGGGSFRRG